METTSIKILIIDDDEDDFFITKTYLEDITDFQTQALWARNYTEGLQKIADEQPDICLLDFLLGNKTGINLLREVREKGNDIPIILLTGKGDLKIDKEAMALGSTDYLIKSELSPENIERSVRYALSDVKAMRAIRNHAQLYQTIFDKSKNMIYLVDAHTLAFAAVNDMATEMFGYSKTVFLQDIKFDDLFENRVEAEKITTILMAHPESIGRGGQGSITDYEVMLKTQKGEVHKCLISAVNHQNLDGTMQFHGTITDISYFYQAEQDRLIAEKMAATSRFTRALAHEVRNPLTNIDLSVEQLESEFPDAEWLFYLDIIKRNSKRIGTLITELLHNSSPLNLEFSTHKLHDLLNKMIEMAQDRITLKGITLIKNYAPEAPSVLAASEAFKIAILNIFVNAIEALPPENGWIKITTSIDKENCFVEIEDNGCGISADHKTRIFEPYVTTKQKGTGLGLITALNVIKAHKGVIRVYSTLGVGTRFLISIPIHH